MMERRSNSPLPCLDLNNFDSAAADRSRYVLTSPRSLESCARLGVKPVQLLIKSLNELIAERRDVPFEAMRVMHDSYEKERTKLLQMCRQERERIIQEDKRTLDRWPGGHKASGLEVLPHTKLKEPSAEIHTTGPVPYADLCSKGKSVSRSTCSVAGKRDSDRSTVCSFSLGDLRHSPATEMQLQKLTKDINKEMCVTVPERDRKIAALMLVKHQEKEARLKLCQHEEQERQEARRLEEVQQAEAEKKRRRKLRQSMKHWHEELEARRRLRRCQEKEKMGLLEQEVMLQEDRWRRLKEEVEAHRRGKIEGAQKEVEQQVVEEEAQMRSTLEKKLQHSCQKRAQVVGARLRELQERGAREDEQIQKAQLRAKLQSIQQLTHKQILVQLSQRRVERAALRASAQRRSRAQQMQQRNKHKQICHLRLREKLQREEEALRKVRENCISVKEWKRERLQRQREQIQEEAHRLARASFHMRERVRQQTHSRTFDRMALEAQLTASISRLKL
nr:PREDICTED: coiled-coil domain-containing protein 177-like [Stegastes partitus]